MTVLYHLITSKKLVHIMLKWKQNCSISKFSSIPGTLWLSPFTFPDNSYLAFYFENSWDFTHGFPLVSRMVFELHSY